MATPSTPAPGEPIGPPDRSQPSLSDLQQALAAAGIGTWGYTAEPDELWLSPVAAALFGLPNAVVTMPLRDSGVWVPAGDRPAVGERWRDILQSQDGHPSEFRMRRADGSTRWLAATGCALASAAGQPHGDGPTVAGIVSDITERVLGENELRSSEERFRLAMERSPIGMALVGLDGRWLEVNPALCAIVGYGPQELLGIDFQSVTHPDDVGIDVAAIGMLLSGELSQYDKEKRYLHKDGRAIWAQLNVSLIRSSDGAPRHFISQVQDITEQRQARVALAHSEAQLRAMFDNSRELIVIMAADGEILRVNREHLRTPFPGGGYAAGRNIFEYFPAHHVEEARGYMAEALAGGAVTAEWSHVGADGEEALELSFSPVTGPDGVPNGVALLARDMTERVRSTQALLQVQKLESLGRLVGGVAHDFNNLLGVILGYAELAVLAVDEESETRADLEGIIEAARSAGGLTRQLLAFARRQAVETKDVDLNELLHNAEKLLHRLLGKDIRLNCPLGDAPLVANIDPGQFEQVIVNLAVNARDAMPDGGVLTIRTRTHRQGTAGLPPTLADGAYAVVEVSDTGAGMDFETSKHIFEPFFTTKDVGKGTGLGLATCYGIVAQSGGHIDVKSELGRGSTFTIHLPAGAAIGGELEGPAEVNGELAPHGELILVIEDQQAVRAVAERVLLRGGYRVLTAENPARALEIASSEPGIDLIISDIQMPMMDGVALTDILRTILGPKPIIFMSGYADDSLLARAMQQDGARFIQKPFPSAALTALVREALDESRAAPDRAA